MNEEELKKIKAFFNQVDENGISNMQKTANAKVIRRVASTDKNKSYEESAETRQTEYPLGVVVENERLIGLGIHIFNEDIYPLQSFEIYLRGCDLVGKLDISDCKDMLFLDIYHNRISSAYISNMPSMRILGLQDNCIEQLDPTGLPSCQGIDIGKNKLKHMDVSKNKELVELYINDNDFSEIDLSHNLKLKYFYCHNNHISCLDTTNNPLLRHMDATGNPLTQIKAFAPQNEDKLPLELYAGEGGFVGLKFNPVYNAQWKETGEWQQSYYAYPKEGYVFDGWYEDGIKVSDEEGWIDEYGKSRVLKAVFSNLY